MKTIIFNLIILFLLILISQQKKFFKKSIKRGKCASKIKPIPYCREVCEYINPIPGFYTFLSVSHEYFYDDNQWKYVCRYRDKDKTPKDFIVYHFNECKMSEE